MISEESARALFEKIVKESRKAKVWTGSYAHGLFDAYVLLTGQNAEDVAGWVAEAVEEIEQRSHDEMIDSRVAWELDGRE